MITLERPAAGNALDAAMTKSLAAAVPRIARDTNAYAIVLRARGTGAFCAGGDVREMARLAATEPDAARAALAQEYQLVWLLECFSKPVISLVNGAVMGAGAGITLVNTHRVAGERYAFAMPEVRLGFFPDDGVAAFLGRMPDHIGLYLGLTGRTIGRDDAFALGLVTHCIAASHFAEIENGLADADPVDPLLDRLHETAGPGELAAARPLIADCFGGKTVEEIVARLSRYRDQPPNAEAGAWAVGVLDDLARACPSALKVALRHIRDAWAMDLRHTLMLDYRVGRRLIGTHDFREGVRALIVDKDRTPLWRPQSLADVSASMVDGLFHPDPGGELILPTREEMQAARV